MSAALAENRCPACAAPRTRGDGACAECGAEAPRTVSGDVPCRRCGYSLKGLATTGVCPECGSSVHLSLMGDFLAASSPAHVAGLARGAVLVEIALYLGVLMLCVGTPLSAALMPSWPVFNAIAGGTNFALVFIGLAGWWLVSAPDPGLPDSSAGERSRLTLRACLLVSAVANIMSFGGLLSGLFDVAPALHAWLVRSGVVAVGLVWIVKYFAGVSYVRVLAARIPSTGLAETAKTALLLPIWTFGLGVPVLGAVASVTHVVPPVGLLAIVIVAGMGVACLVWFIWYCSMVSGLRDRLETVRAMMPGVAAD